MIEPLLLTTVRVSTFDDKRPLTASSGFFFEREGRLFLVTSRHVVIDKPSKHFPNRIEIELHTDPKNLTCSISLSVPLYLDGKSVWRQGNDTGGEIDVAVIELERATLPQSVVLRCFTPRHLQRSLQEVEVGAPLLIVGFPLGFHDALHHSARGAAGGDRLVLRPALPGLGLLSHRCANAPRHQRSAGGDAQPVHRCATALEAARGAFRTHGHGWPRLATR
jgi:hypothetical protein